MNNKSQILSLQLLLTILLLVLNSAALYSQRTQVDSLLLDGIKENDFSKISMYAKKGADVNLCDEKNATALQWAVYKSDLKTVKFLVGLGFNYRKKGRIYPEAGKESYYGNILGIAAAENKPDILKYCIESLKIPVDDLEIDPVTNDTGWTALHYAVVSNNIQCLQYLIDKGANVNTKLDKDNNTPLYHALLTKCFTVAKMLIDNGANVFIVNESGKRPITVLTLLKQPLLSYQSVVDNINSEKRTTNNIYGVYLAAVRYFIAIDSAGLLSDFVEQYVDPCKINSSITPNQYILYVALMEQSYNALGRNYSLIQFYKRLQSNSPYNNLPAHRDFLKAKLIDCLSSICLYEDMYDEGDRYFSAEFSGQWNFYSMQMLVNWALSQKVKGGGDNRKIDSLFNNLNTFAQADSNTKYLTERHTDSLANLSKAGAREDKKTILSKIEMVRKMLGTFSNNGQLNYDTLSKIEKLPAIGNSEEFSLIKLSMSAVMDSKADFNKHLQQYFDSLYIDRKVAKSDRLYALQSIASFPNADTILLKRLYRRELSATPQQSDMMSNFLLLHLSEELHETFPAENAERLMNNIVHYMDSVQNETVLPNGIFMMLVIAYKTKNYLPKSNIDLYKYYSKFSDRMMWSDKITLMFSALIAEIENPDIRLYKHALSTLQPYLEKKVSVSLSKPDVNMPAGLNVLLNYDKKLRLEGEGVAHLLLSAKAVLALSDANLLNSENETNNNWENELIKLKNIIDKSQCPGAIKSYNKLNQVVRIRKEKMILPNESKNKETDFLKNLGEKAAFINFYRLSPVVAGQPRKELTYGCFIYRNNYQKPKQLILFTDSVIKKLLGDSAIYEIQDNAKKDSLYGLLWKPLEQYLKNVTSIYVSPTGILTQLPFDVIKSYRKNSIIKDSKIIYVSLINPAEVLKEEAVNINHLTAFGGINYKDNKIVNRNNIVQAELPAVPSAFTGRRSSKKISDELPGTLREIEFLKKVTNNAIKTFVDTSATELAFRSSMENGPSPEIIHIATHGYYYPPVDKGEMVVNDKTLNFEFLLNNKSFKESPQSLYRCGLIFSAGKNSRATDISTDNPSDGILTGQEISKLNLTNTKLAVLSACNTAQGDLYGYENIYGLACAFKMAGVKYVLASLWEIPDEITAVFMSHFYTCLKEGLSVDEAFQKAKKKFMLQNPDPYNWGAFLLVK